MPFVSVLIDTYNHERFIEEAIISVLEQDFPSSEREILVVDDGSTDGTPEIVKKFGHEVRLLRKSNGGQASAFNAGIPECRGEIIAFLDGDDWWARGKLTAVSESLASDPSIGLVGHGITEVFSDGREHTEILKENERFRINSGTAARLFRLRKSFLGTSRMTFVASLLNKIGRVPEELRIEADEYLFTLGALLADVLILREPLTFYRLHGANAFQLADGGEEAVSRKQRVLETVRDCLRAKLTEQRVPAELTHIIMDWITTEAELLRLSVKRGYPWETVRAELDYYHVIYETAPISRVLLKYFALLPACFMSSRNYYSLRNRLARNDAYRAAREKWLPFSQPAHVERIRTTRP